MCPKRTFNSPGEARNMLRRWQWSGRRKELDTVHVYPCEHREHKGKFHVGHTDNNRKGGAMAIGIHVKRALEQKRGSAARSRRIELMCELDEIFDRQKIRIRKRINTLDDRRERQLTTLNDGPLVGPMDGLTCGDDIDVQSK